MVCYVALLSNSHIKQTKIIYIKVLGHADVVSEFFEYTKKGVVKL